MATVWQSRTLCSCTEVGISSDLTEKPKWSNGPPLYYEQFMPRCSISQIALIRGLRLDRQEPCVPVQCGQRKRKHAHGNALRARNQSHEAVEMAPGRSESDAVTAPGVASHTRLCHGISALRHYVTPSRPRTCAASGAWAGAIEQACRAIVSANRFTVVANLPNSDFANR